MFKIEPARIRLFACSLCMTLVAVATLVAFGLVYNHMTDMGISPPTLPTIICTNDQAVIMGAGDAYRIFSTKELYSAETLRREADPLTLPRPVRLYIKLSALFGQLSNKDGGE